MALSNPGSGGNAGPLRRIMRAEERITTLEDASASLPPEVPNVFYINALTDITDLPLVSGTKRQLVPDSLYVFNVPIFMPAGESLLGHNVTLMGRPTLQTFLFAASVNPLLESDADGYFSVLDMALINAAGPLLHWDLGNQPLSVGLIDRCFFSGDPASDGSGLGSIGTISNTERVTIQGCFFQDLANGLTLDGNNKEVNIVNCSISARETIAAPAFKGVNVLDSATTDILLMSNIRFASKFAADRAILLSPIATYNSPVRLTDSTHRGPGTMIDAAGLQKTDVQFSCFGNEGPTAPADSLFAGNAVFSGNASVETVISASGATNEVPIGTGAGVSHPLFNGGAFVEGFELVGAQTELQRFFYRGLKPRTFRISITCEIDRVGGGTQELQIAIQKNDTTATESRLPFQITAQDKIVVTSVVLELDTDDNVRPVVANIGSVNNMIVKVCQWSIAPVG